MKVLIFAVVALLAAASAEEVLRDMAPEELTAFDYHNRFGVDEAAAIKLAEEQAVQDPSRIVGGSAANLGQYPHLGGLVITLTTGGTSVCGCSLLTNTRAVTAAHCWWDGRSQARQFVVALGTLTMFSGGTRVTTTNVQMHNNWNPNTIANDVAVIVLNWVNYNNNIRNINMASGSANYAGQSAWASGWGAQWDGQGIATSQRKHHVNLPVITNTVCQQTFGSSIIASTLCTSGANGRGTCGGDSGGPLTIGTTLIGITSFGAAAGCQRGFPSAFARVTSFVSWINARL